MEFVLPQPEVRRRSAISAYVTLSLIALVSVAINPMIGFVLGVAAMVIAAADWRVSTGLLLGLLATVILVVPADIRPSGLPVDLGADRAMLAILFAAALAGQLDFSKTPAPAWIRRPGDVLKATIAVAFISLLLNGSRIAAEGRMVDAAKAHIELLAYVGTYFIAVAAARASDRVQLDRVLRLMTAAAAVAGFSAVVERYAAVNPIRQSALTIPFLTANDLASETMVRGGSIRVFGTGEHPIAFGAVMTMLLPIALYVWFNSCGYRRVMWTIPVGLIGVSMLFSGSRSSLIATVVGYVVLMIVWRERRAQLILIAVLGMFAVHMLFPGVLGTFRAGLQPSFIKSHETQEGMSTRANDYPVVARIIPKQPLLGLSHNEFDPRRYFWLDNQALKTVLELGVAGLVCVSLFLARAGQILAAPMKQRRDKMPIELLILSPFISFIVLSLFFDTVGFSQVMYLFYLLTGLGVGASALPLAEGRLGS